jgi:hypothetical protein
VAVNKLVKFPDGSWKSKRVSKKTYDREATWLYENLDFQDKDFIDRVARGKKELFSAFDSYKTMQAAFACEESAKNNKKIII